MNIEKIPEEKRIKIIEVSLKEFAEKGYDKASTNNIVRESSISKGLLFHYFKSKKNLYLYIVDYCIDKSIEIFNGDLNTMSKDFFKRVMEIGIKKIEIANKYPELYDVIFEAFINTPNEVKAEIDETYKGINDKIMPLLTSEINYSIFRKDIDVSKIIEYILLAFEGIQNKYIKMYKGKKDGILENIDEIMREYELYIELIKNGVC